MAQEGRPSLVDSLALQQLDRGLEIRKDGVENGVGSRNFERDKGVVATNRKPQRTAAQFVGHVCEAVAVHHIVEDVREIRTTRNGSLEGNLRPTHTNKVLVQEVAFGIEDVVPRRPTHKSAISEAKDQVQLDQVDVQIESWPVSPRNKSVGVNSTLEV